MAKYREHVEIDITFEEKTVKDLVLELVDQKIQKLEKKGLLPKSKS